MLAAGALACGALAAAQVHETVEEVESRTGHPIRVVVAKQDIPERVRLDRRRLARALTVREVPARYAPRDALVQPTHALGLETTVPVPVGAYLTASLLRDPRAAAAVSAAGVRRGQRLVEIAVTGGRELTGGGVARVDVVVTKEGSSGGGRTFVALENAELVAARPARANETADADGTADTIATLRVGARAAVFLTAAQNFAREVRLLARPLGDRRPVGRSEIGTGGL